MFFLFGFMSLLYSSEDMVDFLKKFVWSSINLHMSYETNGHGHWNCTRTQPMNFFGMAWHGTARHTQNSIHLPYSFSFNSIFKLFIHSYIHFFLLFIIKTITIIITQTTGCFRCYKVSKEAQNAEHETRRQCPLTFAHV